jgi:Tol biopolymer transport system component
VPAPQFALSPDGSAMVFAASVDGGKPPLWLRPMAQATAHPLSGTENASLPFWSPDSKWIRYFADTQLKKIPAAGGSPQTIANNVSDSFGAAWGQGGTILFSVG